MEHFTFANVLLGLKIILLTMAIFFGYLIQDKSTSKVDKWLFITGIILLLIVGALSTIPQSPISFLSTLLAAFVIFIAFYVKHMPLHRRPSKYEKFYG